jgi:hypothetical protein
MGGMPVGVSDPLSFVTGTNKERRMATVWGLIKGYENATCWEIIKGSKSSVRDMFIG